jgi:acyl-coenzyme A synthetase/AMP-(fatty) acid ligase
MNEHRGVVNRLQWMQERYGLSPDDRVLQKTPFSFDVSVWEFFWTLMTGACLVIAKPDGHRDPGYLRELIETTGVTTLHFVPSMLQVFVGDLRSARCRSLRHIVCSGEELSFSLQHRCFACLPQVRLSNLYGPTEAAVDVTAWECDPRDSGPRVPIGRPIANIQMYVLDCSGEPTPVGVAGELHIGGIGVGRGYLNRPELSAERFVKDPFSTDPGARLYKTGDLGRWRADGVLEYLGRNDHQVKIRGFRIELGEIEACLSHHPLVREAVVLAREDEPGEKRLVAYVVEQEGTDIAGPLSIATLKAYLKETLPEHMVPSAFVVLPSMPLTANGKLDRQALPIPGSGAFGTREFEPLQGDTEEAVARIWRTLLNVARVGRQDDFFELGGHSLLGNQMIEQTATLYGVDIPFIALFKYPTVALFARFIEGLRT